MNVMSAPGFSLEDILRIGEGLYFTKFKEALEKEHYGEYAAIDVEKEDFVVRQNKLEAIEEAQQKFGKKLFYIVQIGSLDKPTTNYRSSRYAWNF
jgi:hypothetical protein